MADTVRRVDYFSIEVPDKPGEAFRDDTAAFHAAAAKAGLAFQATRSGFLVQGEDRPGALAQQLQRLSSAGINVSGIDAMGAGAGRWGAILWVQPGELIRAAIALGAR
jgi:hypothetical protein